MLARSSIVRSFRLTPDSALDTAGSWPVGGGEGWAVSRCGIILVSMALLRREGQGALTKLALYAESGVDCKL